MITKKKIISIIFIIFFIISMSSCKSSVTTIIEGDNTITKKELGFYNKSSFCRCNNSYISTYFFNDSPIPLVSIEDYINNISIFNIKVIMKCENDEYLYYLENAENLLIKVSPNDNIITIYNYNFILKGDITYDSENDLKNVEEEAEILDGTKEDVINLEKYTLNIETVEGKAVMPFDIVASLFSYNSYYSATYFGDKYYGFSMYDEFDSQKYKRELRYDLSWEYMAYNYYLILFLMSELNGNSVYLNKNVSYFFLDISSSMLNVELSSAGITNALFALDDPHTSTISTGYVTGRGNIRIDPSLRIAYMSEIYTKLDGTKKIKSNTFLDEKTGYFRFNRFTSEKNNSTADQIYKFLVNCKNSNIENIIFDITMNEGGDTVSLAQILGFMTNDDICLEMTNIKTKEKIRQKTRIDANYDGNFDDNDAFDNFNYYILSSGFSFSCANIFVNYCKENKLATILGQKTGGGACSISKIILPTGLSLQMSTINGFYNSDGVVLPDFGVKVDIEISYDDMYNKDCLLSAINGTYVYNE